MIARDWLPRAVSPVLPAHIVAELRPQQARVCQTIPAVPITGSQAAGARPITPVHRAPQRLKPCSAEDPTARLCRIAIAMPRRSRRAPRRWQTIRDVNTTGSQAAGAHPITPVHRAPRRLKPYSARDPTARLYRTAIVMPRRSRRAPRRWQTIRDVNTAGALVTGAPARAALAPGSIRAGRPRRARPVRPHSPRPAPPPVWRTQAVALRAAPKPA